MKPIEIFSKIFCAAFLMTVSNSLMNAQSESASFSDFDQAGGSSPIELIQGKMSGVRVFSTDGNPSGMKGVQLRGIRSLRGDSQPLYIVDGVVLGTLTNANKDAFWQYDEQAYTSALDPLAFLSAYDIESIEVLKDISASAIYGSKGANGVVIIKTKKASEGAFNINWNSDFTASPVFSHNHNFSINGSQNRNSYNISAFYRNKAGSMPRSTADDAGVRLSFETAANSVVNFGFNSILTMGNVSNTTGTAWFGKGSATLDADNSAWVSDYDDDTKDYRTVNSAYLTLNFTPYLSWKTNVGIDYQNLSRVMWYGSQTRFGSEVSCAASVLSSMMMNYNADTRLTFSNYISKRHHLTASVGAEILGNRNRFNTMNGVNFMTEVLRGKGLSLMQSEKEIRQFSRSYLTGRAFAELGYDYDGIAGVKANISADVTPKYTDYNPTLYPSATGYVDLHKAFLSDCQAVSTIRLEGGWGITGKELFVPYEMTSDYLTGEWEKVDEDASVYYDGLNKVMTEGWNVGLRLGFLSDRLTLGVSYYDDQVEDTYNMYCFGKFDGQFWKYSDREQVYERTASFGNRGFDVDLSADILAGKTWKWTLYADASYNVNRITSAGRDDMWGRTVGGGLIPTVNAERHSIGSFYGYRQNEDGSIKDVTRDGKITEADRQILGNAVPEIYGGFGTTLSYKGISLDVRMDGAAGYSVANLTRLAADGHDKLLESYVEKGDYLRLSRVSLGYDVPLNLKWIKSLRVHASARNLVTFTAYSGANPDVSSYGVSALSYGCDYGAYPLMKTVVLGISAKF